jgi:hypothetical protein
MAACQVKCYILAGVRNVPRGLSFFADASLRYIGSAESLLSDEGYHVREPPPAGEASAPSPTIPAWALVELHGKQFVTFGGLLAMAHERGLVSLKAAFITVTAELALAHAVATFQDGRTVAESGDATPGNVNAKILVHFPRMALTRSKARCLRDALNISTVAVEELGAE